MFGIFDFLMAAPYEERRIGRLEQGNLVVSTAAVNDSLHPFETAVKHPAFNGGKWIIVETYDDRDSARAGHDKWTDIMTRPELPAQLHDVSTANVVLFAAHHGIDLNETFDNAED
jgi:hypothetical protein